MSKDANATIVTFDGTEIGGIESFEIEQGQPRELNFRPTRAAAGVALPGQPDHGRCILKLYRDKSDPGQIKLQASLRDRQVKTCVVTYKGGSTDTFQAFTLLLPTAGSRGATTPVNLSNCVLRISGPISSS